MTKLEELALKVRKLNVLAEIEAEIETALKPLLDAVRDVARWEIPLERSSPAARFYADMERLREQLSQWRKK